MRPGRVLVCVGILAAFASPAAVGAAKKPVIKKSATYTGKTSQGEVCRHGTVEFQQCDISFKTSKDRKLIPALTIRWRAGPCSDDPNRYYRAATDFKNLAISSKAKFKTSSSYDVTLSDGTTGTNTVTLNGRFTRTSSGKYRASGDLSITSDLTFPDGAKTHCETGKVTWSAKPTK